MSSRASSWWWKFVRSKDASSLYAEGLKEYKRGNFPLAEAQLVQAAKLDSGEAMIALAAMVNVLRETADVVQLRSLISTWVGLALALSPANAGEGHYLLGLVDEAE